MLREIDATINGAILALLSEAATVEVLRKLGIDTTAREIPESTEQAVTHAMNAIKAFSGLISAMAESHTEATEGKW